MDSDLPFGHHARRGLAENLNLKNTDEDVPTLPAGSTPATRTFFHYITQCREHEQRDGFRVGRLVMSINNLHIISEKDDDGSGKGTGRAQAPSRLEGTNGLGV